MSHRQWAISSTGTEISGRASSAIVTLFASRILLRLGSRAVHEFSEPISRRVFVTYARSRSQNTNKLARPWIIHGPRVHTAIRNACFFLVCYIANGRCRVASHHAKPDLLPIDMQNISAPLTDIRISHNWRQLMIADFQMRNSEWMDSPVSARKE